VCTALISVLFDEELQNNVFMFSFSTPTQIKARNDVFRPTTEIAKGTV
jgi:hypothetical protein